MAKSNSTTPINETYFGMTFAPGSDSYPSLYAMNIWDIAAQSTNLAQVMLEAGAAPSGSQTGEGQYGQNEINEALAEGVGLALKAIYNVVVLDNDDTANNTTSFASVCSITGAANSGKMETIIYKNETEDVVDENDNVIVSQQDLYITIPSNFVTPNGSQIVLLCPAGGYCEVNYLNIGGTIYVRGL